MEFCIGTTAKIDAVGLVKQAEDVGASHFGVGEGPLLFSDPYQYLALAARETSTIQLGTWVTNPLTRIAPVTANSIATLNALAPGRTFLGIGTANNALRSMGNRPATLSELDSALTIARGLLAGERVDAHVAGSGARDRVPGHERRFGTTSPTRSTCGCPRRSEGPRAGRQARRLHDLLPGPEPGHDRRWSAASWTRPSPTQAGPPGSVKLVALPGSTSYDRARPGKTGSTTASAPARSAPASPTPAS